MKKQFRIIFFLFLFLLTACGGSRTSYKVGLDPSFFPLDLMGKEPNVFAFCNEMLLEISRTEKVNFERINMSWDNLLQGLQQKKYQGMLSSVFPYIFNEEKYSFSDLFMQTGPVLIVRIDSTITSLDEMAGQEVAVLPRSAAAKLIATCPQILSRNYESVPEALNELVRGEVDGVLVSNIPAISYVSDLYSKRLKIVTEPLDDEGLRLITLHDNNQELLKIFNRGLSRMKQSGQYETLLKKWKLHL